MSNMDNDSLLTTSKININIYTDEEESRDNQKWNIWNFEIIITVYVDHKHIRRTQLGKSSYIIVKNKDH